MDNHTRVIIADNSEEFCSSLTATLHQTDRFRVTDTASDGGVSKKFRYSA